MARPAWLERLLGGARQPAAPPQAVVPRAAPMTTPEAPGAPRASGIRGFGGEAFNPANLVGAADPLTLTPLLPGERVHACTRCQSGYHAETFQFLRDQNHGNCVGCRQRDKLTVVVLPGTLPARAPAAAAPAAGNAVTLDKVRDRIGEVVTFEGHVHLAHRSYRGNWFVKFEQTKAPFEGFKLVIFENYARAWDEAGISPKVYEGQTVRVRGLVQEHPTWGLEILVNRPEMVEIVDPAKPRPRILWKEDPGT